MENAISQMLNGLPNDRVEFGSPYVCKSGICPGQAVIDLLSQPAVDQLAMSVRMRISTDVVDRDKMAVRQNGIKLDYYVNNPVVLFGHGVEGISIPVAMSEDEDGNCTVFRADDGTYAKAFHKPADKVSSQMFDAIASGLLRAASVGITPLSVSVSYDSDGNKIPIIDECMLNEWSYCAIGVNQEAVCKSTKSKPNRRVIEALAMQSDAAARILGRGKLDGSVIVPELKKSLSLLLPRSATTKGFDFAEGKQVLKSLSAAAVKAMTGRQLMKACLEKDMYDCGSQKLLKEAAGFGDMPEETKPLESTESTEATADSAATEPAKEEEKPEEKTDDAPASGDQPQGAKIVTAMYDNLVGVVDTVEEEMKACENKELCAEVNVEIDKLKECLTAIQGIFSKAYPEQPALQGDAAVTEDIAKSFLASNNRARVQMVGMASVINAVSDFDKLPVSMAKSLRNIATQLRKMESVAKAYKPEPVIVREVDQAMKSRIDRLETVVRTVFEKLDSTPAGGEL
jgi:hypothetical protein